MKDKKCSCGKGDTCCCGSGSEYVCSLDPNVVSVMDKHQRRAEVGMKKYGVDTTRTDTDLLGWLNHLQEELMDANVYIERAMVEIAVREKAIEERERALAEREDKLD